MKGFTKTKIALATAGAIFTVSALAAPGLSVTTPTAEPAFALNLLGLSTAAVSNTQVVSINTLITDLVIGRTTGFGLRITLTGANFAGTAGASIGTSISANALGAPATDWAIASQNIAGSIATITVSPGTTPAGLPVGEILNFAADALDVTAVNGSLGAGVPVTALIEFFDPVTANVLLTNTATIYSSKEGTAVTVAGGDTLKRIDVGGTVAAGGSKTLFSPGAAGTAGVINHATPVNFFYAGMVTVGLATGGTSAAGTTATAWDSNGATAGGTFQFNTATDTVTVTVSGTDFSSFSSIWLEDTIGVTAANACSAGMGGGNVSGFNNTTPLAASGTNVTAAINAAASGESYYVCAAVNGTAIVDDQTLDASVQVNLDPNGTVMAGMLVDPAATSGAITPMVYNGDVVTVHFFNDNGNTGQQSRLRVSNKGTTTGLVRIVGTDDLGVASAEATITLAAGESVQLKSDDLINGTGVVTGAMGLPTQGKWRLTVTAEYDGLEVTNYVRNVSAGILTDFTASKTAADPNN